MTQTDPVVSDQISSWLKEPAKLVGWIVAAVLVVAAAVTELIATFGDLVPEKYKAAVQTTVGIVAVVTVVATRVQALLTRNKVWSPAAHEAEVKRAESAALRQGSDGAALPGAPAGG